jgi:lysophospholipase L1-like esterase
MKSLRLCFVGDSLVNGTGDPACLGWTGRVCAAAHAQGHDVTYYNLGIRRDTSADIRVRWRDEVTRRLPPTVDGRVVFSFGVNDTALDARAPRLATAATLDNARAVLSACRAYFPVLLVGPTPVLEDEHNARITQLSAHLAQLAGELDLPFLPVFDDLQGSGVWLDEVRENDGAHPRAGGYTRLAQRVGDWVAWRRWFG